MLSVILTILTVLGRILLFLLLLLCFLCLLVLFFPVTYRITGEKREETLRFSVKAGWLFGMFGIRYDYPDSGALRIRLFWKTRKPSASGKRGKRIPKESGGEEKNVEETQNGTETETSAAPGKTGSEKDTVSEKADAQKAAGAKRTISKTGDKIREVAKNLSYYHALLHEDDTVALWRHVKKVLGKVLRSIRPRRLRGQLTFGTGAPDTTGYLFGIYGVFSPAVGPRFQVTPDFTQKILEGQLDIAGHITLFILTWNGLRLFFDRKLRRFLRRLKTGRRTDAQKAQENTAEKENNIEKGNTTDA